MRHPYLTRLMLFFVLLAPVVAGQRLLPGPEQNTRANGPNGIGAKKVAVILFNYTNNRSQPITPATLRRRLSVDRDSTRAFLLTVSFNQMTITGYLRSAGDVFGWYAINAIGGPGRDIKPLVPTLDATAARDGFNAANYDVVIYCHPFMSTGWGGQAFGAKRIELDGFNRVNAAHEILHILGLDHANGLRCTRNGSPVAIGDDFRSVGYGDPFDIQGGSAGTVGYRHPNTYFKARMGWYQTYNFATVPMNRSQTYTFDLCPIETAAAGLQCVRIPVPRGRIPFTFGWGPDPTEVDLYYYLEFRQPDAFDDFAPTDAAVNGVSIRLSTDIDTNHMTSLIDTRPATTTFADAPLTAGQTFRDPVAGVTVKTVSVSTARARVQVTMEGQSTLSAGPHLLWTRTDGMASLWSLDAHGFYRRHRYYGPYPGMQALAYQRVDGNTAKMLWCRGDGLVKIWTLDACDNVVSVQTHGPFPSWTARSYQRLSNGTARLLWSRTDGLAAVWYLDARDRYYGHRNYGPYPGWTARSYQKVSDGAKLLWSRTDGLARLWTLNLSGGLVGTRYFGPYLNWMPTDLQRLTGSHRLLWTRTDGKVTLWTLDRFQNYVSHVDYGPFENWSAHSFSIR